MPYKYGRSITQSADRVWYAAEYSIVGFEKSDDLMGVEFLSKVEGLSDAGMSIIKYVPAYETLIASYQNSNVDLVKPNRIVNLPFIKEDVNIVGDRNVYDIYLAENGLAYLACGFGVVELNVEREEFGFTTKMGIKANTLTIFENDFYVATDEGIYRAPNNPNLNLQDFGNWDLLGTAEGFPADYGSSSLVKYNDKLYVSVDDTLFTYADNTLDYVYHRDSFDIRFLSAEGEHLILGSYCNITTSCQGYVLTFDADHNFEEQGDFCVNRPHYAIEDESGRIWYSDRWDRIRYTNAGSKNCTQLDFKTDPFTHNVAELEIVDDQLWVTTEKPGDNREDGYFLYDMNSGNWEHYNNRTKSALGGMVAFYSLVIHPENKDIYVGSLSDGLVIMSNDAEEFQIYDDSNSPLSAGEDTGRIRVSDVAFDDQDNLWVTNNLSSTPLQVLKPDGTWLSDFPRIPYRNIRFIAIDQSGNKWLSVDGQSQAVVVFNEFNLDDPNDDEVRILTASNSNIQSNRVNCITVDLDGDVWVGTRQGATVFECGANVFDPSCQGTNPIVEVEGIPALLLETEEIQCITVDGANRKWFGTTNGVFVQSPSGEEQVAFFDAENSPLFSNEISDIAIHPKTGEVFIATSAGMLSLREEATEGGINNSSEVYAFPNPVRPEYDGPIAINGLARDANVKITDVNGQLVFEGIATGGQMVWDGRDYNGRRASSGVYLVFSTSTQTVENPDAIVTKILLLN